MKTAKEIRALLADAEKCGHNLYYHQIREPNFGTRVLGVGTKGGVARIKNGVGDWLTVEENSTFSDR